MFKYSWVNIFLNFICKLILFWIGIYYTIFTLAEIYRIQIYPMNIAIYTLISLWSFIVLFQSYKTALISSPFFVYLFIKLNSQDINFISKAGAGFCITVNNFLDRISNLGYKIDYRYNITALFPQLSPLKANDYITTFLTLIIVFLSFVVVICAYKKVKPIVVVYIIIILMFPGILFKFMPSVKLFRIVLSFIISLLSINIFYKFINVDIDMGKLKKSFIKTSFCGKYLLLIFIGSYLLNTVFSYIPKLESLISTTSINEFTVKLDRLGGKINSLLSFYIGFNGGVSKGKLGQGGFRYSNIPMLDIYTDSNMTMYLRTWVGKDYFNNMWSSFGKDEMNEYLKHFGQDFMPEQITWDFFKTLSDAQETVPIIDNNVFITNVNINYINANKSLAYIPTISNGIKDYFDNGSFDNNGEGVVSINKNFNIDDGYGFKAITFLYSTYFKFLTDNGEKLYTAFGGSNSELEKEYRDFVYSNYIYLPVNLFETIKNLVFEITKDYDSKYDKVLAIQQYLAQNYTYNLNPPPTYEKEKDFVEYFLFESKQGYCTYYATSMVLMLRTIGIPARYAEGYLVPKDKNIEIDKSIKEYRRTVFDKDAHAWPEVYFDSIGWIPFEPTVTYTENLMQEDSKTVTSNFSDYKEDTSRPFEAYIDEAEDTQIDEKIYREEIKKNQKFIPALCWLVIALLLSVYIIAVYRNLKHFNYKEANPEQTINLIIELLGYLKITQASDELPSEFALKVDSRLLTPVLFNDILDITFKTRFSKNTITSRESEALKEYVGQVIKVLYSRSNIIKKFYYRFILFIR